MTNKEILHADLLDILFENRNKTYGAYALRKNYSRRLQWALGISLGIAFLLSVLNMTKSEYGKKNISVVPGITLRTIEPPGTKKIDPPKRKVQPKTKQVAYTDKIKIDVKTEMPDQKDIAVAEVSNKNVDGNPPAEIAQTTPQDDGNGAKEDKKNNKIEDFHPTNSDAQFPGGKEAFTKFLSKYLVTPGELEAGEKRIVLVRFMVDADGTISKTEILQSDGEEYSREVVRVLKKMPKWLPAQQNGIKVATWFTQPVSFIGVE